MIALWLAAAFAAEDGNIKVEGDVAAPPAIVEQTVSDLTALQQVFPAHCVQDWVMGPQTKGVGATTRMTYRMGPLRRRLDAKVTRAKDGYVDLDHAGNKGFVTRWTATPNAQGGSHVVLETHINLPPWPFKRVYLNKIRPIWRECWTVSLQNLDQVTKGAAAPAPVEAPPVTPAPEPAVVAP